MNPLNSIVTLDLIAQRCKHEASRKWALQHMLHDCELGRRAGKDWPVSFIKGKPKAKGFIVVALFRKQPISELSVRVMKFGMDPADLRVLTDVISDHDEFKKKG